MREQNKKWLKINEKTLNDFKKEKKKESKIKNKK